MNKVNWFNIVITMLGFTPFKGFLPKLYIGKVAVGTPYFLPRRWVKNHEKEGYLKAVPRYLGFDFVSLGWKWKFDSVRHEWNPVISFVIWKFQIAIVLKPKHDMHYWETWLNYVINTPNELSSRERVGILLRDYPNVWISYKDGKEVRTDYGRVALKNRYLK